MTSIAPYPGLCKRRYFIFIILWGSVFLEGALGARTLTALHVNTPPVMDGRLDDSCWKDAAQANGFSVFKDSAKLHPEETVGRVCYDDNNLYVALECKVKEMDKFQRCLDKTNGQFKYWEAGTLELFFDTNADGRYSQYMFHANGSLSSSLRGDFFGMLNNDFVVSKTHAVSDGFNLEVSIPLAVMHFTPKTAGKWGFNLNRVHDVYGDTADKNLQLSSWNSTGGLSFNTPARFGKLVLDGNFSRYYWKVDYKVTPQLGDKSIGFTIENQTGKDFSGQVALKVSDPDTNPVSYQKTVNIKENTTQQLRFDHFVTSTGQRMEISLVDSDETLMYLGGTQRRDVTRRDKHQMPSPGIWQKEAGYMVFSRPYTRDVLYTARPKTNEFIHNLSINACRGEFEPVTFSLYPLRTVEHLEISASDLIGPGGSKISADLIDIRKVTFQSVWQNMRIFAAREHLLRKFDQIDLTKGMTQRIWVTVRVPEKISYGEYRGKLTISSGDVTTPLELSVNVLPFELSDPDEMAYFMYMPGVGHKSYSNPVFFKKIVQDMRNHGMTTFTIYNRYCLYDKESGKHTLEVDKDDMGPDGAHVQYGVGYGKMIDILREEGLGTTVPLIDITYMKPNVEEMTIPLWNTYKERNWPEVAFYINDEIDFPERIKKARKSLTELKTLSDKIKTVTAMGDIGAKALGDLYDIWICTHETSPETIARGKSTGKLLWRYTCQPIYAVGSAYMRNFFGRYPWRTGYSGVGVWAYAHNNVFSDRFAQKIPYEKDLVINSNWKQTHGHVCFEKNEIIPVVTWEAIREGIDDYRYMLTLKTLSDSAISSNNSGAVSAGKKGLTILQEISDATDPVSGDARKFGTKWQVHGDMDADRTRVIKAILEIQNKMELRSNTVKITNKGKVL